MHWIWESRLWTESSVDFSRTQLVKGSLFISPSDYCSPGIHRLWKADRRPTNRHYILQIFHHHHK